MSSYAGSIATMDRCFKVLVKDYGIDIVTASKMLSLAPAKHIKADNIGKIAIGYNADFVIANKYFEVLDVMKNGILYQTET